MEKTRVKPQAKIIGTNANGFDIAVAAGRLSRSSGTAEEIFEKSVGNPGNGKLINKVLAYGHETIAEHIMLTIAFDNVSLAFEQFMISHRLASFTVKSRRSVNFKDVGYHIPIELEGNELASYVEFMDDMFAGYIELIKLGIPLEDARYLLPYSTHSSFYCTLNLRELIHILEDVSKYGQRHVIPSSWCGEICTGYADDVEYWSEGQEIRNDIITQLTSLYPDLASYVVGRISDPGMFYVEIGTKYYGDGAYDFKLGVMPADRCGKVSLMSAWPEKGYDIDTIDMFGNITGALYENGYATRFDARRLELLGFLVRIDNISLAALTHLTRHRTQSLKYGDIPSSMHNRFIIPDSIARDDTAWKIYDSRVMEAHRVFLDSDWARVNNMYTVLAGSLTFAYTSMNVREFIHFARLRMCNRAQWEIRAVANNMFNVLEGRFDIISHIGPPCAMDGKCDQGSLSCGHPYPKGPCDLYLNKCQSNMMYGV